MFQTGQDRRAGGCGIVSEALPSGSRDLTIDVCRAGEKLRGQVERRGCRRFRDEEIVGEKTAEMVVVAGDRSLKRRRTLQTLNGYASGGGAKKKQLSIPSLLRQQQLVGFYDVTKLLDLETVSLFQSSSV